MHLMIFVESALNLANDCNQIGMYYYILQLGAMSMLIDKLNHQRQSIRRAQLDHIFQQKRMLMQPVISKDVNDIIFKCLEGVKKLFVEHTEDFEAINNLTLLHATARDYNCVSYFCQFVCFTPSEAKTQLVSKSLTWLDLLLLILRDKWQLSTYYEQTSSVIAQVVQQLSWKVKEEQDGTNCHQQMRRVMENYPYEFLKEDSATLVGNSLQVIYFLITTSSSSVMAYHLLNNTKPPLLKMLNLLYNKRQLMAVDYLKESYLAACISIATIISRYNLEHLQSDRYNTLCSYLLEMATDELEKSQSKEEFSKACCQLTLIYRIKSYTPSEKDFRKLEGFMGRQIEEQNEVYFKLLDQYIYLSPHKLSSASFRQLTAYLFNKQHEQDESKLSLRVVILKILKLHIINCDNRLPKEDLHSFTSLWGECAFALHDLAESLQYQSQQDLKLLFEILSYVIIGDTNGQQLVTKGYLHPLLRYCEYRLMLQSLGYELSGEENDEDYYEEDYA